MPIVILPAGGPSFTNEGMKAIILAGGLGTRLAEETTVRPKPMVEIGGKPILWHIMKIYSAHGINEFVVALGYKGDMIKQYFLNFVANNNDLSVDIAKGRTTIHGNNHPDWKVHLVDTGERTETGGRLKRLETWLQDDETFCFTYGDGVADLDIAALPGSAASSSTESRSWSSSRSPRRARDGSTAGSSS
jgi:glucose-1-phosphate cytidylyltransferase